MSVESVINPGLVPSLEEDPRELNNLAQSEAHNAKIAELTGIASILWNAREIKSRIIADQNRRRLVERAHGIGHRPVWDYQPITDASTQWVRGGKWIVEVEADAHLDVKSTG